MTPIAKSTPSVPVPQPSPLQVEAAALTERMQAQVQQEAQIRERARLAVEVTPAARTDVTQPLTPSPSISDDARFRAISARVMEVLKGDTLVVEVQGNKK